MHGPTEPDSGELHIAIVGGGASGTLTAVQLLRHAGAQDLPVHITLIDRHGRHGLGQAYSTRDGAHLLNAMAGQMSALPDDPEHLLRWASTADPAPSAQPAGGGRPAPGAVSATTFLRRQDYGRYLRELLAEAERQAPPGARLTCVSDDVIALRRTAADAGRAVRLRLAGTRATAGAGSAPPDLDAAFVVLATGSAPARLPFEVPASERIIADPWLPGALDAALTRDGSGSGIGSGSGLPVVIAGTGLTMIDLALSVSAARPAAVVHAISRHGLLPRTHPGLFPSDRQLWLPVISRTTGPVRLGDLMWQVRSTMASSPAGWHGVMDSLRPYVPGLWRRMPEQDKRLFLRHVARYWEVHRHLMAPATAARITTLRASGQLAVHRGHVVRVTAARSGGLRVLVSGGADTIELEAGWLINGTGATGNIRSAASPLLRDLFASGQARPDPLGLGLDATSGGAVLDAAGRPSDAIFTLGPPLRGLWYETTAIPEIREQAASLARRITSASRLTRHPGSAA